MITEDTTIEAINHVLVQLNRFKNYSYKVEYLAWGQLRLVKRFHQGGKAPKCYDVVLLDTDSGVQMIQFIEGLIADKQY